MSSVILKFPFTAHKFSAILCLLGGISMSNNQIFVERLKSLRKEKGITQKQLATDLGISLPAVINYENAQRSPSSAVLTLLSRFFNVSKEYLLGESDERGIEYTWDDPEIMETVRESIPAQISGLNDILKGCSTQEQKLTFDILVELSHVLRLEDQAHRAASIALLQNVFAVSTRFMDVCANATQDIDATRIEKAQQAALAQYNQALKETLIFSPD